jgi:hypothetical protein
MEIKNMETEDMEIKERLINLRERMREALEGLKDLEINDLVITLSERVQEAIDRLKVHATVHYCWGCNRHVVLLPRVFCSECLEEAKRLNAKAIVHVTDIGQPYGMEDHLWMASIELIVSWKAEVPTLLFSAVYDSDSRDQVYEMARKWQKMYYEHFPKLCPTLDVGIGK